MEQKTSKKRIIIYSIVLICFALLIVFLAGKRSKSVDNVEYSEAIMDRGDNISYEAKNLTPVPSMEMDDGLEVASRPAAAALTVTNTDTGNTTTVTTSNNNNISTDKKVIKTGTIDMRVNSIETAIGEIKTIAIQNGGDEVSSDFSKSDSYKEGYITVKVPVNQYDKTFEQIKKIAPIVTHESSQAQDVTAQFIDLESRIKNKKQQEEQLRSFFDRAKEVDELIQVEQELARVRTEIEQMEGRLKYLKDQTQYSTIDVTLFEDAAVVISDSWRPLQVAKDSFNTLIDKSTALLNTTIRFTITSLPFIILFIIVAWFLYFTAKHIFGNPDNNKKDKK